jgi:MYXO-CTERM domain-containing protein
MRRRLLAVAPLVASLCACDATPPPAESIVQPIYGGQLASACQWPTTVLLPSAGCSGTLVHPSIIITAAHCGIKISNAVLGEDEKKPARTLPIEYCRVFQGENGPSRTDYAFCKLKTPVTDVPIVPILMGCETDILKVGQKVIVAGFGDSGNNVGYGTKRWVETTINQVSATRAIQVGGMGKAPCYGDSGGPAFVKLADGSWRAFGIDSAGLADSCTAGDVMAMMHEAVPWIEQQSGLDITPCHDADGTWHPGPGCGAFSVTPDSAGRSWATGCAEPTLSPPVASCGPPTNGADADAAASDAQPDAPPDTRPDTAAPDTAPTEPVHRDAGAGHLADASAAIPPRHADAAPEPDAEPTPEIFPSRAAKGCGCALGGRDRGEAAWLALGLALLLTRRRR